MRTKKPLDENPYDDFFDRFEFVVSNDQMAEFQDK